MFLSALQKILLWFLFYYNYCWDVTSVLLWSVMFSNGNNVNENALNVSQSFIFINFFLFLLFAISLLLAIYCRCWQTHRRCSRRWVKLATFSRFCKIKFIASTFVLTINSIFSALVSFLSTFFFSCLALFFSLAS